MAASTDEMRWGAGDRRAVRENLGERLELDTSQLEAIEGRLQYEGVEIRDDRGKPDTAPTEYRHGGLAEFATDALQLSMKETARRLQLRPAEIGAIERTALDELALRRQIAAAA